MKHFPIAACLAALLLWTPLAHCRPLTPTDLVQLERVGDPQLSPDGQQLAYTLRSTNLDANKATQAIWLLDVQTGKTRPLTHGPDSASSPRWSAAGDALYFLSARGGSSQVWRLPLAGGEAQRATNLPLDVGNFLLSPTGRRIAVTLEVFPDCEELACSAARLKQKAPGEAAGVLYEHLFVRHWDTWHNGTRSQLFTLPLGEDGLAQGKPTLVSRGIDGDVPSKPFGGAEEITFTPDGAQIVFSTRVAGNAEAWSTNFDLFLAPADGSAEPRNLTADNPALDTQPRVTPDGRSLVYLAMRRPGFEADRLAVMVKALDSGKTREVAPAWDRSAGSLELADGGKLALVTANDLGQTPLFSIRLRDGRVQRLTGDGHVGAFAARGRRIVYSEDALDRPADLFATTTAGGRPRRLTAHNQRRLEGIDMAPFEPFRFAGWNDETVHGYVVKPVGFQPGHRYPVAFIVHGGPQGSMGNNFHYRWNPEVFAGMGYAVVFIDFHGSTGYGQAFTDSISGDWGGKPLTDLQKGWSHALDAYDFLDGGRACALGASYGGYMINWIAGNWPDAFDCLVNHDGVFDLRSMAYSTEELWFPEWEMGGTPFKRPQNYERHNPVRHVDRWNTPMLVVHGALDFRVPLEQGLATFTALQRRGVPSQLLYFPDENHWVQKPKNSIQWHHTVQDWLHRWIGGAPTDKSPS